MLPRSALWPGCARKSSAAGNPGAQQRRILIGNVGDGTISAFDAASGRFAGTLLDGNGAAFAAVGLSALAFRADGFGDPNTLYFTSQVNSAQNGIFGAIMPGLVSAIRLSIPDTTIDAKVTITANVSAGPGNTGNPTGLVTFLDGTTPLGTATLSNGSATISTSFAPTGVHAIAAQYSGDRVFLPVSETIPLQVTGLGTMSTLVAPTSVVPGSTITLTATINSLGGIPTGQVAFLDGNTNLGTSSLDGTGVAFLRINSLAAGTHNLTASYAGDDKLASSTSAGVTINIASPDFSVAAIPGTASVIAGQSAQFLLTVTPAGGFANNVVFSCLPINGVTCSFNPATLTPADGAASTTLTVTTSATVSRYGTLTSERIGPWALLFALGLWTLAMWTCGKARTLRPSPMNATVAMTIVAMGLAIAGCGGYGSSRQANRGTAIVMITAQSGTLSHSTNVTVTVQ